MTFTHGLAFVLGFSLVFITLGVATSAFGRLLFDLRFILSKVGGIVVIIFGLHMIGVFRIPFLEYDTRVQQMPDRKWGYLSSALMGVFFSAGWAPCVGTGARRDPDTCSERWFRFNRRFPALGIFGGAGHSVPDRGARCGLGLDHVAEIWQGDALY